MEEHLKALEEQETNDYLACFKKDWSGKATQIKTPPPLLPVNEVMPAVSACYTPSVTPEDFIKSMNETRTLIEKQLDYKLDLKFENLLKRLNGASTSSHDSNPNASGCCISY